MSDDRFGSKKSQGLDGTEISRFKEIRHNIQSPFSGPNTPKHHSDLAKPAQDETYYSKVNAGRIVRVQKGDSVTDVMSNLYNLVHKNQLKKREHSEISKNFDKEKVHKEKKKHDEFIGAFGKKDKKLKKLHKKKDESKDSNILFKLAAAVLVLSQYKAAPLLMEKMGGLVEKLSEGMNLAWGAAKDKISKLKPFAPSVLEIVTIPVMNWLHDQLAGMFGEDIIDKFFKKQPEVDIKALGVRMKSALLGEDEITKSTRDLTDSLLPSTSKQSEDALTMGSMKGGKYSPSTIDKTITTGSQKDYYNKMYDAVYKAAKEKGLANPEAVAELGAAQTSLETGYGKHMVGNNAFGIKAKKGGDEVTASTQEFEGGKMVTKNQSFRKYGSPEESAKDYVDFLAENKRYAGVLSSKTGEEAISAQGKTGYATDPAYFQKLKSISAKMGDQSSDSELKSQIASADKTLSKIPKDQPSQLASTDKMLSEKSKENIDMKKQQSTPRSVMFKNDNTTNIMNNTTQQTNTYAAAASTNSPYLSSIGVI